MRYMEARYTNLTEGHIPECHQIMVQDVGLLCMIHNSNRISVVVPPYCLREDYPSLIH